MNIWLIQTGEPLPLESTIKKMRTAILADKLLERGHNVVWWVSAFDHFQKRWLFDKETELKLKENLTIKVLKGIGYVRNISLRRFIDHRIIAKRFKRIAPKISKPDIIIASMPPHDLAFEAVMFARNNNIPVLVDIRDPWPDIFLNHMPRKLHFLMKKLFYRDFRMVNQTMQKTNGLIAVTNTFLEWGLQYAKRKKFQTDKVFYLGGQRIIDIQSKSSMISELVDRLTNKFVITFVGTFAHYHNPSILVDCAVKMQNSNVVFVLAGDGEFFSEIKSKISSLNNIFLTGRLDQTEIDALLRFSSVGVCPTTQNIDLFPNKAFTYLSAGLPIISAFQGDLKDIIEKYQIGVYYPPCDVDALVNCINRLYEDRFLYKRMSENAHRFFDEMCDADKIYDEYAKHIEMVANDYKQKI
ncbi:MAG: hypothetical protein HW406_62 [Candidatus Brocadiaceae bacterium]|nr:hypothetical protein [Candidatus Brocadiaceae bacterium]